jgi:hypothetical protein
VCNCCNFLATVCLGGIRTRIVCRCSECDATARRQSATPTRDANVRRQRATPTRDANARRQRATPTRDVNARRQRATRTRDANARRQRATPTRDANALKPPRDATAPVLAKMPSSHPARVLRFYAKAHKFCCKIYLNSYTYVITKFN